MKKVILIIAVFMTSLAVHAQSKKKTTATKSTSYYSFAWGLFKSKNYPKNKTAVVKVVKQKILTSSYAMPLDSKQYEKKSILWGAIQWTEKNNTSMKSQSNGK
jgi:hypothetical protein